MGTSIVIKSPTATGNTGLPFRRRDPIWAGKSITEKGFGFDLSFDWSNPQSAIAPADGQLIRDTSEIADGILSIAGGVTGVTRAGGGLDFTAISDRAGVIRGGAGCLAEIYAGSQYFMVTGWAKMPSALDWNKNAVLSPIFCTTSGAAGYPTEADMLTVAQHNTPRLDFRRQTNGGGTVHTLSISNLANFYGRVCQWAYWRNADGTGARLKSALGEVIVTGGVGDVNTGDFGSKQPRWGVTYSFNEPALRPDHAASTNMRIYRGHVEHLTDPTRLPLVVANLDWDFAHGLGRYS